MESALIVCEAQKSTEYFKDILMQSQCSEISTVRTSQEARRMMLERDFDLCIINAPLIDEFGESLSKDIASHSTCQIILVVKAELFDEVCSKVEDYGVITVAKPINKTMLWNAIKFANVAKFRMRMVQKQNEKLLQKIDDIKLIDRAKLLLISYLNMTEEQAHKYIERQAMDMRLTKRDIAQNILKTYDS